MGWFFSIVVHLLAFNLMAAELQPITIHQLNKKIKSTKSKTLVNLWATWCAPCVKEFPIFVELQNTHKNLTVLLVSMDYDSQKEGVKKFLKDQKVNFTTYMKSGNESEFISGFLKEWQGALPVTVLYGPGGKVVKLWQEEIEKKDLQKVLNK